MKKLLISLSAFVGLCVPSAFAGQVMPNLYAREYCSMRDMGVNKPEARRAAVHASYVSSLPDLPTVTIGGTEFDSDVVRAYRAVETKCPYHL